MLEFCTWLEATQGSTAIRESILVYPIVETTHVLTLCLFLGLIAFMDLRLIGVGGLREVPVTQITGKLLPLAVAGFGIMVVSGLLLFYSGPLRAYQNIFFRVKMLLMLLAGANALFFHLTIFKQVDFWDVHGITPPKRARLAGLLSLIFWSGVVICGRMQAYKWFQ